MKTSSLGMLLIVAIFVGSSNFANADDKPDQSSKPHDQLKRLVGNWTTEMTSFYPNPEEPTVTKGKANFRMILGGNFVEQRFTGEVDGQKYQGIGVSGFDAAQGKYVGTWMDSLNTGIMHTEGTYDVKTHSFTETSEMSTPGGKMKTKHVTKYVNANNFLFTMYMVTPDGEQKIMEINYTRTKGDAKPKEKKDK
jgi:hypothetical protein